jgi:flagellar biosynthesis chaperone FliJ
MSERNSDDNSDPMKIIITASNEAKCKLNQRRSVSQPLAKITEGLDKKSIMRSKPSTSFNKLKETATNVKNIVAVTKEKKSSARNDSKTKVNQTSSRHQHHHYGHFISHYNSEKQQKIMHQQYFSPQPHQGLNISMDFRVQTDENGDKSIVEECSNLFLYLDLHGHASKKGVFMYGNHLPNTLEAVEVMLLPRLMSMNCHHFAFDACNFSERNMYLK